MSSSITLIFILLLFFDTESFTGLSACQFAYTGHPMNSRDPPAFATTDLRLQVDAAKPHLNAEEWTQVLMLTLWVIHWSHVYFYVFLILNLKNT